MKKENRVIAGVIAIILLVIALIVIIKGYVPEVTPEGQNIIVGKGLGKLESFTDSGNDICYNEEGKPIVYLFSTTTCPHCKWIKDTFDQTVLEYVAEGKIEAHHYELDTGDDTLTSTVERSAPSNARNLFSLFSPNGYVPAYVFGCKYFRVGNPYESRSDGLEAEEKDFRAVIDALVTE